MHFGNKFRATSKLKYTPFVQYMMQTYLHSQIVFDFVKKDLREVLEEKKKATRLAPSRADRVYQQQQPGRSRIGGFSLARSSSIEPLQKPVSALDTWTMSTSLSVLHSCFKCVANSENCLIMK